MKKTFLPLIVAVIGSTFASADQVYNYPADEPIFSIAFPDKWQVDAEDEQSLSAAPEDELAAAELIALDAKDAADAIKEAQQGLREEFKNLKIDPTQNGEVNGLKISLFNATNVDEEGTKIIINCALFVPPKGETYFMLFFVSTPESVQKHGKDINSILQSVKAK